jgi:hypothetical protein
MLVLKLPPNLIKGFNCAFPTCPAIHIGFSDYCERHQRREHKEIWTKNYYTKNRERIKARLRQPEVIAATKLKRREYRARNKQRIAVYYREWAQRPIVKTWQKEYHAAYYLLHKTTPPRRKYYRPISPSLVIGLMQRPLPAR